jgi:hypothetical protein
MLSAERLGGFLDPRHQSIVVMYDGRLTYDSDALRGRGMRGERKLDEDELLELLALLETLPPPVPSTEVADDCPTLRMSHRVGDQERHFRVYVGFRDEPDPAVDTVEELWGWLIAKLPADARACFEA